MKRSFNVVSVIANALFVAGVLYTLILINSIPSSLFLPLYQSNVVMSLYIVLSLGVIAVIVNYILMNAASYKEVIYVDRIVEKSKSADGSAQKSSKKENIIEDFKSISNSSLEDPSKAEKMLSLICAKLDCGSGIIYKTVDIANTKALAPYATFAMLADKSDALIEFGDGLVGVAAKENRFIFLENTAENNFNIFSGLGSSRPLHVIIIPLRYQGLVCGIMELSLITKPNEDLEHTFNEISEYMGNFLSEEMYVTESK